MTSRQSIDIPELLEQALDPQWLTQALTDVSQGATVTAVNVVAIDDRVASNVRISVDYDDASDAPRQFCLKGMLGEDENLRKYPVQYKEAMFYREIAPHIGMRVPQCPLILIDDESHQALIIMEDLIASGATFNTGHKLFNIDDILISLDQLARLHAASDRLADNPWIVPGTDLMTDTTMRPASWLDEKMADGRGGELPRDVFYGDHLVKGMQALVDRCSRSPQTLLHGDTHIANTYTTAEGPGFADWQLIKRGLWAMDIGYHINTVLPTAVAAAEEQALISHYLDCLERHGGKRPDPETIADDYACSLIYGFYLWAITQFVERPIIHQNYQSLGNALLRHDSFARLGL